jgi:hypothetical protein
LAEGFMLFTTWAFCHCWFVQRYPAPLA